MNVKRVSPMSHRTDASDRIPTPTIDAMNKAAQIASAAPGEPVMVEYELTPTAEQYPAVVAAKTAYIQAEELRYNPAAITEYYRRHPFQVWGRLFNILAPLLRFGLGLWWDKQTGRVPKNERKRAIQLRKIITRLGPAYIKVGQALSTRPDLVPTTYLDELSHLQDQLPPFPNELAYRFIEEELGDRPEQIYAELSPTPVAAASLGQVYKGKLKTGETVAVKVQRPGLRENIALDIYILRTLAGWAQRNLKQVRSDLVSIMDEFGTRIYEEMDYTQEGHNAERFASLYGHLPDIYIPKIYWQYTQRRVLTMEWINGTKLTQPEALRAQGIDAVHLIEVGVQCSLRQLLEHGFFHADPHPGNLLATTDGQLAYLDFGMMSDVKPYQRYGLIEAVVHMVNRDFEGLARDYVNLEFLTPDTDLTPIIPALSKVFSNALGASVAEMNFKSITDDMSALMYEYPFRVPAYYALIIRSLVTLEGIAINVDPNFKVLSKAYPYVAKRLLTDPSPELRASLRDLLFKDGSFRWNRLENLLKNARFSDDYDLTQVLNQTLDFLFSERGAFIREHLTDEIVKGIDTLGRRTFQNVTYSLRERVGMTVNEAPPSVETSASLDHIKRIWDILQETNGFDPMQLLPVIPQFLMKPETQRMGQKIAGGLVQRVAARLIRDVLLQDAPPKASQNGHKPRTYPPTSPTSPRLALPPAAVR
ncbi:AarF/ABC1/UbiB kinase family protein [Coleofasciculus sp. FACHB-1120]|uniref:ABC1 kinase family protein n=1 Tax=Coleofasciculus sp. FACHB-1120 TaxID=2692783 RepID=UPI001685FCA3|nr:AarF/ABC1/UbiB kinase family protein [Coleofasciculus sp. FACHB-1120]MBD2740238.1 AarF/ABC1/UbiB kinase family protein [Coleofasciculus sp. FACHB-1120]